MQFQQFSIEMVYGFYCHYLLGTFRAVEVKMGHEQGHMAHFLHFVTHVYFEVDEAS